MWYGVLPDIRVEFLQAPGGLDFLCSLQTMGPESKTNSSSVETVMPGTGSLRWIHSAPWENIFLVEGCQSNVNVAEMVTGETIFEGMKGFLKVERD